MNLPTNKQIKGNIYLAKVTGRTLLCRAAFVDFCGNRHGFLAFSEKSTPIYYQSPRADRDALLAEEAEAAEEERTPSRGRRRRKALPPATNTTPRTTAAKRWRDLAEKTGSRKSIPPTRTMFSTIEVAHRTTTTAKTTATAIASPARTGEQERPVVAGADAALKARPTRAGTAAIIGRSRAKSRSRSASQAHGAAPAVTRALPGP